MVFKGLYGALKPRMSLVQGAERLSGTETVSGLLPLYSGLLGKASQRSAPLPQHYSQVGWEPKHLLLVEPAAVACCWE